MILSTLAFALLAAGDVQSIEAEAQAPLSMGYTQAVQRAKDGALRQVILKACKQLASSDPSIAQCAVADDRLFAGFAGLVSKLEVLSQETVGDAVRVKVRAEISLKAVSSDEIEARRLYQRLGTLKLSIDLKELLDKGGGRTEPTIGLLASKLSEAFRAEGWKLFPYTPDSPQADYALFGNIITEPLEPQPEDYEQGKQVATRARVKGQLEITDLVAKRVVGKVPLDLSGSGKARVEAVAAELIAKEAPALAMKLRAGIVKALREGESRGAEVVMTIGGLKTEDQSTALVTHLQKVTGVLSVEQPGPLVDGSIRLNIKSTVPAKDLARTIAKAMGDKVSISGVRATAIEGTAK